MSYDQKTGEIETEVGENPVLSDSLGGQLEKALLDSKKVQVAASVQDLADVQALQSTTLLGAQPAEPAGADLSSDFLLTVHITSQTAPT